MREDGMPDLERVLHDRYHPSIVEIRSMPKPVVAALNGPTVGVGLGIALSCDLVVAKESAYLLLAFVNIGLVPDGGSSVFVPARGGFGRAMEMALLGEKVPAPTAERWNLVNRVYADDAFDDEVAALMDKLASGPTRSYAGSKRQLNAWLYERMEDQLGVEAAIQGEMAGTADVIEGIGAFLMKREPSFIGS
jgi:2-(1,2-epoxy-1,2-dihydrophenyl)acetyl-CoA isomerase